MGTEKFMAFKEDGTAYRLKGRILRHLDNEPVTDADKSNIRDTLGISGTSGDLLAANNLDDVANAATSRTNLDVNSIAQDAESDGTKLQGPSMRFDGSNDHISIADDAKLSFAGTDDLPFSGSAWIKPANIDRFGIFSKWQGNKEYLFYTDSSNKLSLLLKDGTNSVNVTATAAFTADEWQHVAFTYAGSGPNSSNAFSVAMNGVTLYINGKAIASTATNNASYSGMNDTPDAFWIGAYSGRYSEGEIREVKLFNKALSASEVKTLCLSGSLPESFAESTGGADVVTDGGFENWNTSTDLTNWSEGSAVSTAQSTDKISGTYSCKITGGGDIGSSGNNWLSQGGIAFNADKKYRLTGKVKRFSGSTNTLQFGAKYYKIIQFNGTTFFPAATSTQLPFIGAVTSKDLGNGWYSFSIDFTTNQTNTLTIGVNGSTDPYLVDDVSLVQIGSVLDARAEQFDTSTGKLYDLSGNSFVGTQSGGVSVLGREMPVYETGTWTPSVTFGGSSTGIALTSEGIYTRIGNTVTIHGVITFTDKGGESGSARITGLPFTAANTNGSYQCGVIGFAANLLSLVGTPTFAVADNGTELYLQNWSATDSVNLTNSNFKDNTSLRFSATYEIQ